jgi:hypothetical protein
VHYFCAGEKSASLSGDPYMTTGNGGGFILLTALTEEHTCHISRGRSRPIGALCANVRSIVLIRVISQCRQAGLLIVCFQIRSMDGTSLEHTQA